MNGYDVVLRGKLTPGLAAVFQEYDVLVGDKVTHIRCSLPDQSALHGLLDRVRDLGLEIVQVSPLEPPAESVPVPPT